MMMVPRLAEERRHCGALSVVSKTFLILTDSVNFRWPIEGAVLDLTRRFVSSLGDIGRMEAHIFHCCMRKKTDEQTIDRFLTVY
jgi:hypothetical protein